MGEINVNTVRYHRILSELLRKSADGFGARTYHLAGWIGTSTPTMRGRLKRLAEAGLVQRSERYSAVNDTYWTITDAGRAALSTTLQQEGSEGG